MSKEFASEADMCTAFLKAIPKRAWVAYPETHDWDILLVRKQDGFQIGIQAKLRANIEVMNQTIEKYRHYSILAPGPDCRAVLVPSGGQPIDNLAHTIGITVVRMHPFELNRSGPRFTPDLPTLEPEYVSMYGETWHEFCPWKRLKLPDYVPDVAAGVRSPIKLTPWKICAIKLVITLEKKGSVTKADFKALKLDYQRWVTYGWFILKNGLFRRGPCCPLFREQHPIAYAQIEADYEKWSQDIKNEMRQPSFSFD